MNSVLSTKYLLRTKYGILVVLLFISVSAWADDLADRIVERLASYPVVRAEFVQERTVASLTKPVVSSGRLVFSREGLIWQVETPVKLALVYSASGTTDGGAVQAEMGRLLRALIAGDLRELRTTFDVKPSGDLERWSLHLQPKTYELAQYLRGIELAGGKHLEAVGVVETNGDRLSMRMHNFVVATELDAAERRRFLTP
jgi:outer membrane lipoprotein carrier protein LolA